MFVGKRFDFILDGWYPQITADDVIPVELVCWDNGMKDDNLTTLHDFNVRFSGMTPQLYAKVQISFLIATYMRQLFSSSNLQFNPISQYNLRIFSLICYIFYWIWCFPFRCESRCIPRYLAAFFCGIRRDTKTIRNSDFT